VNTAPPNADPFAIEPLATTLFRNLRTAAIQVPHARARVGVWIWARCRAATRRWHSLHKRLLGISRAAPVPVVTFDDPLVRSADLCRETEARPARPNDDIPPLNRGRSVRKRHQLLESVCVLGAYILAGEIGLAVPFTSANVSPLWPPAGVALAAMLIFGYRIWPAVAFGAFIVNLFTPVPHLSAVGIALGNTVGPLCGTWLLRRLPRFQCSLSRLRDVLGLSTLGALCGTAVSATAGAGVLFLSGVNAWSGFASAWLIWWLGDAMGVLIVTPVVLTFTGLMSIREERRLLELACLLLGAVGSALAIFEPRLGLMRAELFAFGVFPFVLWGAIRFETAGAAVVSFLISAVAVSGTAHGFGPFIKGNALQNAMLLESFLAVTAVSGIMLAAAIAERAQLIREQAAREALERSEKHYRGIVETAYEGIWKLDNDFNTSFANQRMAELLGYTVEEMLCRPVFAFLFETDVDEKRADLQRRRRGVSQQLETRYRKKDGSALWARVATSPILGEDGAFEGALAMVSDITEQKRADAEASRSRETISLLSRAVEQTADSIVITDHDGTIEYVNPAFEATTGYAREEAVGKTPRILKSALHDEEFYSRLWGQILRGEAFRGTLVNRKKCGALYWTEQTITPIKDRAGVITHFVSVLKDITDLRKQQEQELQLRLAREVQQRFYTCASISSAGFDIASVAYPADETGGDYLDSFSMPDGRICIGIGDVSGHGLPAALIMALTRAYVRSFAQTETNLAKIVSSVNHMLRADLEEDRFVTMLQVCLDGPNGSLSYANAGHVPGFVMNASGSIDAVLESSGPPLGIFDDPGFVASTILLKPQQVVVLLTDGASEMTTSEDVQFGSDGVLEYVRAHRQDSARELADGIYHAARTFAGDTPLQDDVTVVIVKVA
jgi:PAS domain S-box-containing protein